MKSMKKNYLYNLIFTIVNIVFPLITAPYLSLILGAENIGKVNYATSIVTWFTIFAGFGIPRYGVREIARNREDRKEMSNSFWNLLIVQLVLSIISIIVYLILIFNSKSLYSDIKLHLLMILMIVLNIFSIDWFYQGIEEYKYITLRNVLVKIISIALIFIMIKNKENYILYALINILGLSFNNILNYLNIKKYIDKRIYKFKPLFYIKELKVYFMITLVVSIYTQLDQTFIGSISQVDLAYYLRSKTVLGVGFSVVNSITTIFIPRTAYLVKNNYNEYSILIQKSINYIYFLAIPCMIGMLLLSEEIMIFLGGNEFINAKYSLYIISILTVTTSIGSWQVNQILLPNRKEKIAFKIQAITAIISISLNIILIPKYTYIGAAISWILSEIFLTITEAIAIRRSLKSIKIDYFSVSFFKYLISAFIMGIGIIIVKNIISLNSIKILISLIIGPLIYLILVIFLKDKILFEILSKYIKINV